MRRALVSLVAIALGCTGAGAVTGCKSPAPLVAFMPNRPPPAPRVISGDLDANVLFGEVPARASRLGAGPATLVASGEAVEGERVGAFVELPSDACVLAYARASSSIEDLDLAAFDDDGSPLAIDEGPDPKPTLLLCAVGTHAAPSRVYIAAHVVNGEGLVGVAAQTVPRDRASEVARALGAHGAVGDGPQPADAWQGLDDHVRAHRQALGGTWDEFRKAAVVLDSRVPTVVTFPVEADSCVDAVLVPGDEVALLEVEAVDDAGRVVARAREGGSDRTLTVCSPMAFEGSLLIRPHVGRGLAAVVLAKTRASSSRDLTTKPDVLWEATSMPLDAAKTEREGTLARAGYGGASSSTKGDLPLGRRATIPLDLGTGAGCTRIDVVAGAPLSLVDARVWSEKRDRSELVTSGEGAWGAALFACTHGKVRLDLEARGRGGPFAVTTRPEKWKDAAFARSPLAAARMMARAADGSATILDGVASGARALSLDPDKLVTWTETVAAGQCLQVSAGAEGEGTGMELRAFDTASGDEIDRSHAQRAVSVRACAELATARGVRLELRTTSGRLDVVVGERTR
jgi:hypothetical protein